MVSLFEGFRSILMDKLCGREFLKISPVKGEAEMKNCDLTF
jgi:hypothetical protein